MIRKIIAATCLVAAVAFAAPASADGYRHGRGGGYGKHYGYNYYGHNYYGRNYYGYNYYGHGDAAVIAGSLLLGAFIGHLIAPPRTVYVAPPQPVLGNCRTIYGTGNLNGRLAEYSGTGCYDAYGNLYATPGSERFLRYLD